MASPAHLLAEVRREAIGCTRCPLYLLGTQTVFGEGPAPAAVMLVGEQPGDREDREGRPFVGPAGELLDRALLAAGVERKAVYVTNAVKHFKNEPRGKRRIHKRPNTSEIDRCKWWLDLELQIVKPKLVVALGATAARSLVGRPVKVQDARGRMFDFGHGRFLLVTVHPSLLLRIPDQAQRLREFQRFVGDLGALTDLAPAASSVRAARALAAGGTA